MLYHSKCPFRVIHARNSLYTELKSARANRVYKSPGAFGAPIVRQLDCDNLGEVLSQLSQLTQLPIGHASAASTDAVDSLYMPI